MSAPQESPRLLHIHGSLASGNRLAERCLEVAEGLPRRIRHTFVSNDGAWSALDRAAQSTSVERRGGFPSLSGWPGLPRLQKIAQAMADYHLVLTYGRAGIVGALAHTLFGQFYGLPPLIHHEDGTEESARARRSLASTWLRRLGLGKAAGLVVTNELVEHEALVRWHQPIGRIKTINDGVPLDRLATPVRPDTIPRLIKRPGERWIGCTAPFCLDGGLEHFLEALTSTDASWHLVIAGSGPGKEALERRVGEFGLEHRVHLIAPLADAVPLTVLSDVVAVLPGTDPLPHASLLAMAAGKPIVGFEPGGLAAAVAPDNRPFIVHTGDTKALTEALVQLTIDDYLCRRTGEANRERAMAERDRAAMIAAYRRLYASAMGRDAL